MIVLLAYLVHRSYIMFNKINPTINKKGLLRDLNNEGILKPSEKGFSIAFGIGQELDPRIGYYSLHEVDTNYTDGPDAQGNFQKVKGKR